MGEVFRDDRNAAALPAGLLLAAFLLTGDASRARADAYPRQPLDVLHYDLSLSFVPSFSYEARAQLDVRLLADGLTSLTLDLDGPHVDRVSVHGERLAFRHEAGRLAIDLGRASRRGEIVPLLVEYHGVPDGKGLRAATNSHRHPTLFADNWPQNARRFIPSVDHPSDKATVDFTVTAEDRYDVVAPGRLVGTRSLHDGRRETWWSEGVPIPTYCMVFGLAEFKVTQMGAADGVPISSWVYPEDAALAGRKLSRSALVLERLSDLVAPYPFEKLAHVQSSTAWGATEYASAVFYAERQFQGESTADGVVAHEIAHQWWGDSVTAADWDDIWLSEGFATYFHGLFEETLGGRDALREHMARAASAVKEASAKRPGTVVEPSIADPAAKLSPFTYEKGAWVLHMLRRKVGDEVFFRGLRRYYAAHAGSTATTEDLRQALEAASGQDLAGFFQQWLRRPGFPELRVDWRWDEPARQAIVDVAQVQAGEPFELDLDLAFRAGDRAESRTLPIRQARESSRVPLPFAPEAVAVDPGGWLLHTATVAAR
ncbi:MAG TPA: M1 family metallopeptidase [Vicinamibacteria bacterium]